MAVHPTAIVSNGARLGRDVTVGPYAIYRTLLRSRLPLAVALARLADLRDPLVHQIVGFIRRSERGFCHEEHCSKRWRHAMIHSPCPTSVTYEREQETPDHLPGGRRRIR